MDDTALAGWVASSLAYLTGTCTDMPWTDATSERTTAMTEATERTIDPLAILEDLDARRRTLTQAEREQYRACIVIVCALSPAAKAAYRKWSGSLIDLRTSAAVVIAAARAEDDDAFRESVRAILGTRMATAEDAEISALMDKPGVLEQYDGYMHAFHGTPVEGCVTSAHAGPDYEAGFRRGLEKKQEERQP